MKWFARRSVPATAAWSSAGAFIESRWQHVDADARRQLIELAHGLEKRWSWEGLDGFVVSEDARAHISTVAALLVLGLGPRLYSDVTAVLVAATSAESPTKFRLGTGLVAEGHGCVLGSALLHGPVRLSWDRVLAERSPEAATSVIIHEFAHKIDMADGEPSGTPPIADRSQARAFERTAEDTLDVLRSKGSGVLRSYAGTNRTELFAVASEAFFLRPDDLAAAHPALFSALETFYRQTPERPAGFDDRR